LNLEKTRASHAYKIISGPCKIWLRVAHSPFFSGFHSDQIYRSLRLSQARLDVSGLLLSVEPYPPLYGVYVWTARAFQHSPIFGIK